MPICNGIREKGAFLDSAGESQGTGRLGHLTVGVDALLRELHLMHVAVEAGERYMSVVDEGEEGVLLAVDVDAPALFVLVEVEAYHAAVSLGGDGVAAAVAVNDIAAVVALDDALALRHGILTTPELDAVEHEDVGQGADLIYRENPEGEEHELVDELVAYLFVPGQELVGELEAADAGAAEERCSEEAYECHGEIRLFHK